MINRKFILRAGRDPRFTLLLGWALGALTNIYPLCAVFVFSATAVGVFLFVYAENRKELKKLSLIDEEVFNLAAPDIGAQVAKDRLNQNLLVSDKAIEIVFHPNLNSAVSPEKVGWEPREIEVEHTDLEFDSSAIIERAGGVINAEPPNNKKYCLVNTPFVTAESPHLKLELKETDYFTIETAKKWLQDNQQYIDKLGHVAPEKNKIPSSLCLHFTVRLQDGEILLMKRSVGMSYHENKWSITGEEQLSENDLQAEYPIEYLFKRALGEEVLHLGNIENFPENAVAVKNHIKYMRVYSIGTEWPIYNPALFSFVQLNDDRASLKQTLVARKFGSEYSGQEDREGCFYTISNEQAFELLSKGTAIVKGLFNESEDVVEAKTLHPTSRYRLFRLLRILKRNKLVEHNKKNQRIA